MKGASTGRRRRAIISSTMTPIRGSLAPFLDPASVAVIGASRDPFKVGGAVVANPRPARLPRPILPGNSRAGTGAGLPSAPPPLGGARARGAGFALFASLGTRADVNESDLLDAGAANPETRVIAGYIEGVADGPRFLDALRRATAVKPVVLLKAGRSAEGARAVASHTGALAGSDRAFDAAARQAGALRVETVAALFDGPRRLASQPPPRRRRLVVGANGGRRGLVAPSAPRAPGVTM